MHPSLRKFREFIGPYPYNPTFIFLFFFAIYLSRFGQLIVQQPFGLQRGAAALFITAISSIPALLFAGTAIFFTRFRPWSAQSLVGYISEVIFGQGLFFIAAPLLNKLIQRRFHANYVIPLSLTPALFIGSLVLALTSLALMHRSERAIQERLVAADLLVEKLESGRRELIKAEEELRSQTSRFLHDRIQSDLMVIGMHLKSLSGKELTEIEIGLDDAIQRLEKTRVLDLKDLIEVLTPNLSAGTLQSSFNTLFEKYRQMIGISTQIDEAVDNLTAECKLGIFRIVEQAVLNSLVHGPARNVQVVVTTNKEGITEIVVADDGPGTDIESTTAGVGTAIIDSWVGILQGAREIDSAPGHGYRLHVVFPK